MTCRQPLAELAGSETRPREGRVFQLNHQLVLILSFESRWQAILSALLCSPAQEASGESREVPISKLDDTSDACQLHP
jgi:hypothetical protein